MRSIEACRTAALGGHLEQCDRCGAVRFAYHSCRNRHCPKCQTLAKERWLAARRAELLPVPYFHLVFTLPHALNALAQGNPGLIYGLLFQAAAATLLEFGANPRWLGGEIALTMVLHTWGQNLNQHLHVHCLVSGGALAPDESWISPHKGFLFPVKALSKVFRGKYLAALDAVRAAGRLHLTGSQASLSKSGEWQRFLSGLRTHDWVVYAKRPFAGPEQVLNYLGRYTHRVALSNNRLVSLEQGTVRFRWKDYAHGNRRKTMSLKAQEFIRRFLLHILPQGFMRIRHYGLNANRAKAAKLALARAALDTAAPPATEAETVEQFMLRVAGIDIHRCPLCRQGRLHIVSILAPLTRSPAPMATGPPWHS
jgi:hypothetical protein